MLACDFFHIDCAVTSRRLYVSSSRWAPRYVDVHGHTCRRGRFSKAQNLSMDLGERYMLTSPPHYPQVSWERSSSASCPSANRTITVACPPTASR
jgi:hypothetical protein